MGKAMVRLAKKVSGRYRPVCKVKKPNLAPWTREKVFPPPLRGEDDGKGRGRLWRAIIRRLFMGIFGRGLVSVYSHLPEASPLLECGIFVS